MTAYILGWIKCIALTIGTILFLHKAWKEAHAPAERRKYDPARYNGRPARESIYEGMPVSRSF